MGIEGIDPRMSAGTYVDPADWNRLIRDPETILIDTRNEYEAAIGRFRNAVNPHTESFRDFPEYVRKNLDPEKHRRIAMYCTGGIRCEKSTAYLKELGFEEVYHLKGGILQYFEEIPEEASMWEGECFVFDNRVAVGHTLEKGVYELCHACRRPISEDDRSHSHFCEGVSCPHCYHETTPRRKDRFLERERQMELARQRCENHIGTEAAAIQARRRRQKQMRKDAVRKKQERAV
jgi:UPF0176 protein